MTQRDPETETIDSGFALFIVLSFLLIAAAITTPFLANARIEALVSRNVSNAAQDKVLLRGILEVAALRYFELYQTSQTKPARSVQCKLPELDLHFDFQDHSGLIDLNAASADVLKLGIQSFGIADDKAQLLGKEIVRYRSVENTTGQQAAGLLPRDGYKNALFENAAELNDLLVPAGILVNDIDQVFTVHSATGTVDEAAAPWQLLALIEKIPAIDRYFLVNDTRRTNAITVSVNMQRFGKIQTTAKAIFGRGQSGSGVQFFGPATLDARHGNTSGGTLRPDQTCEAFFDSQLLQALQEVTL